MCVRESAVTDVNPNGFSPSPLDMPAILLLRCLFPFCVVADFFLSFSPSLWSAGKKEDGGGGRS